MKPFLARLPHLSRCLLALVSVSPSLLPAQSNYATPYAFTMLAGSGTEGRADGESAHVSGASATSGIALVEVYAVP